MKTPARIEPTNGLLDTLPMAVRNRVLAESRMVGLEPPAVLSDLGAPVRYVYFPLRGFISVVTTLDDGAQLEIGVIGGEGMLGSSLALGASKWSQHATVQGAGAAMRLTASAFQHHLQQEATLRRVINGYIHVLMDQLAQRAACTHYHRLESRLAHYLLMAQDRSDRDSFHLTHNYLAYRLGVRRAGITHAAGCLQGRGLIHYHRGVIRVTDRDGLRRASCDCYRHGMHIYQLTLG